MLIFAPHHFKCCNLHDQKHFFLDNGVMTTLKCWILSCVFGRFMSYVILFLFLFFSAEDLSDVFGKREVKQEKTKTVAVSQLSRQLEESLGKPNNPFLEYSKFDGEVSREKCFWFLCITCLMAK